VTASCLLLLHALPTARNAERVNLWRKLRKFGAVQLKTGGYILPEGATHLERFQWLSKQIRDAGGEAMLMKVAEIDGLTRQEVVGLFNVARAADYKDLASAGHHVLSKQKKARTAETRLELPKLKRRFGEIRDIDFFNSPAAHDAEMALQRLEMVLIPRTGTDVPKKLERNQFVGKTWLTRPRPGIDRAGSAWLIRKFIDAKARFIFDMDPSKHPAALPFDMSAAEFSHQGEDCTFETLINRFGIRDPTVLQMAEMVHDADLEDNKFQHSECIGINRVLTGWARSGMSDDELLAKGIECFEGLYRDLRR